MPLVCSGVLFSGLSTHSWQLESGFPLIRAPVQPLDTRNCGFKEDIAKLSCIKLCRVFVTFIIQLLAQGSARGWLGAFSNYQCVFSFVLPCPWACGSSHCQSRGNGQISLCPALLEPFLCLILNLEELINIQIHFSSSLIRSQRKKRHKPQLCL